jgi:hypothetical protein
VSYVEAKMNRTMNRSSILLLTLIACLIPWTAVSQPRNEQATYGFRFQETAKGGVLYLFQTPGYRFVRKCVAVETGPGDGGDEVTSLLAATAMPELPSMMQNSDGSRLVFRGFPDRGEHSLAGTETGLGIPPPPAFLSAAYNPEEDTVRLSWTNPSSVYESVAVRFVWDCLGTVSGDMQEYVVQNARRKIALRGRSAIVSVVGQKSGIPSNAAAVEVKIGVQSDTVEYPFTANTMPNWRRWSGNQGNGSIRFEQRSDEVSRSARTGSGSVVPVYYQGVTANGANAQGGIYRKFLGLTPGNTYRVSARVNTWEMDDATQEWSYSFHACPGYPDGREFTPEQFAGLEPIPDGGEGPEAACVVSYGPGETTNGQWVEVSTGDENLPGKTIGDIILPEGVTEIVLWIRHTGTDTTGVGLDWSSLEDLSITGGGM